MAEQLPPGWTTEIDPNSGRVYYANSSTGESSWDPPEGNPQTIQTSVSSVEQELRSISAGQISDYCWAERRNHAEEVVGYSYPIPSNALQNQNNRPMQEFGRIETRLHTMYDQLRKISNAK